MGLPHEQAPIAVLLGPDLEDADPRLRGVQERLQACSYAMAHPDRDRLVPACVQHAVLDTQENLRLMELLPIER